MFNKTYINGSIYNLVTLEDCYRNPSLYNNESAILITYQNTDVILPIRQKSYDRTLVGAYPYHNGQPIIKFRFPCTEEEFRIYSAEGKIANFEGTENMYQMMQEANKLHAQEFQYLTNKDNVYVPVIGPNDTPHMKQLKNVITYKNCDLNRYASRFVQFANDKRKLSQDNITLDKLITYYQNLDVGLGLVTWDVDPNVPNPTGKITVSIATGPYAGYVGTFDPEYFFSNVKEVIHYNE